MGLMGPRNGRHNAMQSHLGKHQVVRTQGKAKIKTFTRISVGKKGKMDRANRLGLASLNNSIRL